MSDLNLLIDASFLKELNKENIKTYYIKILVLDRYEIPIRPIEGRVSNGSISINGNSNVRRAGSVTFLAEETKNDLTDVDNLLSMNKKIKILIGLENTVDKEHDEIIWFNQGIFVITNPSLQHNTNGVIINLQFKDKMCLLNGECGGGLPTSITFHAYDQMIVLDDNDKAGYTDFPLYPNNYTIYLINNKYYMWSAMEGWDEISKIEALEKIEEKKVISVPQRIYDIIQTVVCNFGNEDIAKVIINDVPLELKASVRYVGGSNLYYNSATGIYTLDESVAAAQEGDWIVYKYNEDCGYVYTDFTFPDDLVSSIGDKVTSVLDKIVQNLGNFEYFYDLNGNFVFQEKKNYLNTQYDPVQSVNGIKKELLDTKNINGLNKSGSLINNENYFVDFSNTSESIYTFDEGSALINAYTNTPNYSNIKNDYHIWGKNSSGFALHYHIAIKQKPTEPFTIWPNVVLTINEKGEPEGKVHFAKEGEKGVNYTPNDWRAEIYMRALQKQSLGIRPDIYEQELLDLWDSIYDMSGKKFKVDVVNHPNDLQYWMDYIDPVNLFGISVDAVGVKMMAYQQDKIKKMYNTDIPDIILINSNATSISQASIIKKCEDIGQPYSRVIKNVYDNLAIGTIGYTAQETARELMYQYTDYAASISITSIPIYYLDVNRRITVNDRASGIYGDYVVNSINLPLDGKGTMTIQASQALKRV